MRLFICHKKSGEIVSVARTTVLPEGLHQPYVDLGADEAVLAVEVTPELEALAPHEIAEGYTVDVPAGRLERRAAPPSGRARRRRAQP